MNQTTVIRRRSKQQGSALVMAVALSLIGTMAVTGAILAASNSHNYGRIYGNSESALLLADGGVNAELNKIAVSQQQFGGNISYDTPTSKGSGAISNVPGTYTVWTSADAAGTTAWNGTGPFYVVCVATVQGATKTVSVQAQSTSLFDNTGIFAINGSSTTGGALSVGSGSTVKVYSGASGSNGGVVGTNGSCVHTGTGCNFSFGSGLTCGSHGSIDNSCNTINSSAPIYSCNSARTFPTCDTLVRSCTSLCGNSSNPTKGCSTWQTWNWMAQNCPSNCQSSICTWSGSSHTLSTSSCTQAYTHWWNTPDTTCDSRLWTNADHCNVDRNTGKSCIILQPGDYYFTSAQLTDTSKELIIDNGGVTCANGNASGKQVRIWVCDPYNSGNTDKIACPITLTNPNDTTTFRIYYGTQSGTLNCGSSSCSVSVAGCVYATDGNGGCKVNCSGNTTLSGSIIADKFNCSGGTNLTVRYVTPGSSYDQGCGTGVVGGTYNCVH